MPTGADQYYIAVDGGGSKTEFCLYEPSTKFEKHFFSNGTNFKTQGSDAPKSLIDDGLNKLLKSMEIETAQIKGLVMGLSGCDSQEDHDHFMRIAETSGIAREKIYICNDCELAFFSKGAPPGLSVVAGTGSIATGIDANHVKARSGGWGSVISDEGSGTWIGGSAIKELLRYCDGYGEYKRVFDVIREHMKEKSFDALPAKLSQYGIKELAGFAKPVMDEAEKGDAYCLNLVYRAAELIAQIAYSVYEKLNFSGEKSIDLVMAGSLFKNVTFCESFQKNLATMTGKNNICFCGGESSPVMGGIALAHRLFC